MAEHNPDRSTERDFMYRDYEMIFQLYRMDADIHYRRTQMMLALESALVAAVTIKSWDQNLFPLVVCVLGIILSWFWRRQAIGQRQFMELRKRQLRNLEAKLSTIGGGIDLFTVDQKIFHPKKDPNYIHQFAASGENFPDDEGEFSRKKIKAGTTKMETYSSVSFLLLWIVLLGYFSCQTFGTF